MENFQSSTYIFAKKKFCLCIFAAKYSFCFKSIYALLINVLLYVPIWIITIPPEHREQVWQTNEFRPKRGFGFLRNGSLVNPCWQQTLDFNLGIYIPKQGLDDATADQFAKKMTIIQQSNTVKQKVKQIHNIPSCNLSGKSLWTGSLSEYNWVKFTGTTLLYYIQKPLLRWSQVNDRSG